ncbi:DUF2147 domain-containing protein [Polaribacter huanghezhanensis]|uniref:DUF2147 domain-containing protein n=1 Tax=Polaribacter huanghezhanensis TaxID=1354726 RepID=UPI002648ECD2|nr:DUF2147 domain-containing protein [Polaribacter huanghezhanensis]
MKKLIFLFFLLFTTIAFSQSILGKWKSVDEETNKDESIIEVYQENGKFYGKIIQLLDPKTKNAVCENCKGKNKNKPIKGLVIINGLKKDGDEWSGGKVLDPKNGKEYKCYITLKDNNTMKLRGYIGFSVFGRTAYWYRIKN